MDKIEIGDLLIKAHDLIRELDQAMRSMAPRTMRESNSDHASLTQEDLELLKTLKEKGDSLIMEGE